MKPGPLDTLAKQLTVLSESSSLPASSISRRDRLRLQSLFDAGVIEEVRSGAGRRIIVINQKALQSFIQLLYPSGLEGIKEDLPARSRAVAERRDSKRAKGRTPTTLLIRGFNLCSFHRNGAMLPVAEWTESAGVAALCLDSMTGWQCQGILGLVENLETFWHIEKVAPRVDLAVYAEGRIGADVLDWLRSPGMSTTRVIHFPDYDPVGMDEFLRIKRACSERAELFLPADLDMLFARYGKAKLLQDSVVILARLRKSSDVDVRYVVDLMDQYGVGLEQEGLLINQHRGAAGRGTAVV